MSDPASSSAAGRRSVPGVLALIAGAMVLAGCILPWNGTEGSSIFPLGGQDPLGWLVALEQIGAIVLLGVSGLLLTRGTRLGTASGIALGVGLLMALESAGNIGYSVAIEFVGYSPGLGMLAIGAGGLLAVVAGVLGVRAAEALRGAE